MHWSIRDHTGLAAILDSLHRRHALVLRDPWVIAEPPLNQELSDRTDLDLFHRHRGGLDLVHRGLELRFELRLDSSDGVGRRLVFAFLRDLCHGLLNDHVDERRRLGRRRVDGGVHVEPRGYHVVFSFVSVHVLQVVRSLERLGFVLGGRDALRDLHEAQRLGARLAGHH